MSDAEIISTQDKRYADTAAVANNRAKIASYIVKTPVLHLHGPTVSQQFGEGTELYLKLETFQPTGSFKVRSVLSFILSLSALELKQGLVTMSAGNHAAAVAYAAQCLNISAKVIMPRNTNPRKVALSARYGASVVFVDDFHEAQQVIEEIVTTEKRTFVPAWGDSRLLLGTASIGLELVEQCPPLGAMLVAIGGGSICAGSGSLLNVCWPNCHILAAEPAGADTLIRSFASGKVEHLQKSMTIAEGLAPPSSCAYFLPIIRDCVDDLQAMSDQHIVDAMRFLFEEAKLAIEPSGAGAMAAAMGPYREQISGKKVAVIVSGSNIDFASFANILSDPEYANSAS